jgi:phospholipid/cholesterol/gamma-HCH transport system permease protein
MATDPYSSMDSPQNRLLNSLHRFASVWGTVVIDGISMVGDISLFAWQMILWMFRAKPKRETLMPNFYAVGVLSLPVVALTGTFIGMVLAIQSYHQFKNIGLETFLGAVINMSLVRELGPVLAATMLAGRVGSAMAAVLGTMRVTEQIDALKTLSTNPIKYLVVPRIIATIISLPILVIIADIIGVMGGYAVSVYSLNFSAESYIANTFKFLEQIDVVSGLTKAAFFGFVISVMGCYFGYHSKGGAEGVGIATTNAVVSASIAILLLNYIITGIFFG